MEGKSKGFDTARAVVRNPGIISIMAHLMGWGIILKADYGLSPSAMGISVNRFATQQVQTQSHPIVGNQASDNLNDLVLDRNGMYLGIVDEQVENVITF